MSFAESPVPGLAISIVIAAGCVLGFLQTGRKIWLAGVVAALLLAAGLVWLEEQWVTDRESIHDTIHGLAESLEANQPEEVLAAISPNAQAIRANAQRELSSYVVRRVDVKRNLRIEIQPGDPPRAIARFNVVAEVAQYSGSVPRFVELHFVKDPTGSGKWLIENYRHASPQEGYMKKK